MGSSFRGPFVVRCDNSGRSVVFDFRLIPSEDDSLWNHYNVRPQGPAPEHPRTRNERSRGFLKKCDRDVHRHRRIT